MQEIEESNLSIKPQIQQNQRSQSNSNSGDGLSGRPQRILIPSEQSTNTNIFQLLFNMLSNQLIMEVIRLFVYGAMAFMVFYIFFGRQTSNITSVGKSYQTDNFYLNKNIRGVFPPLGGRNSDIIGRWELDQFGYMNNKTQSFYVEFKSNGDAWVQRQGCNGYLKLRWRVAFFNIFIKPIQLQVDQNGLSIDISQQDEECIKNKTAFFDFMQYFTVWTIMDSNLYILSQYPSINQISTRVFIFIAKLQEKKL